MREFGGVRLGAGPAEVQSKVVGKLNKALPSSPLEVFEVDKEAGTIEYLQMAVPDDVARKLKMTCWRGASEKQSVMKLGGTPFIGMRFVFLDDKLVFMRFTLETKSDADSIFAQLDYKYGECKDGTITATQGRETFHCYGDNKTSLIFAPLLSEFYLRGVPLEPFSMLVVYDDSAIALIAQEIVHSRRQGPGTNLIR